MNDGARQRRRVREQARGVSIRCAVCKCARYGAREQAGGGAVRLSVRGAKEIMREQRRAGARALCCVRRHMQRGEKCVRLFEGKTWKRGGASPARRVVLRTCKRHVAYTFVR